jgi:GH15 family glucan-1,4-alpha-glucosidase
LLIKLVQYLQRLFQQPRLVSSARFVFLDDGENVGSRAVQIAAENLRAGIERRLLTNGEEKLVLNAGLRNFREPWARDFGFASYGLLALGEERAARECLDVFLHYQAPSGQFPVKVHSTSVVNRYIHSLFRREQPIEAPLRPKYITAHNTISLDGNGLLVNAFLHFAEFTGDHEFARENWDRLQEAIQWMESSAMEEDGLLHQGAFADWADTIARQGKILYTNVIYWRALKAMAEAAERYGDDFQAEQYARKYHQIGAAIEAHFWRPDLGYYATSQAFDNLSSSGNLLAIAWGLADEKKANSILDVMRDLDMANPVPTRAVHRAYPDGVIALENRLIGLANYHTEASWLWLGAWHIISLVRLGRMGEARQLVDRMAAVIVRDKEVHEVYAPSGFYLSNFWYTSEAPLTWSAGMIVYACSIFRQHMKEDYEVQTFKTHAGENS